MILKTSENKYKNSKQIDATVELSDSDSDSYFEKSQNRSISPKKKIKLPFPIFDDDDSNNENERSSGETMGQMSRLECKRSGTREELFPVASSTPCKQDNKRLKKTIGQLPETLFKKQQKHTPISALENEKFSPSKSFKITLHDSNISTIFGEDKEMNVSVQNGLQKTSMILNAESESESCQVKVITTSKQHISSAQIIPSTPGQNITKSRPEKSIGSPKNANSPRKTISGPSTTAKIMSPPKRQNRDKSQLKPEEQEGETLNFESLNCIKELFQNTLVDDDQKKLLMKRDIEVIEDFLKMNVLYQYLLMKLFLYLPKWYNIMKFCSRIKLDQKMTSKEITVMYMYLKNNGYVETDISALGVEELLSMLSVVELKQICTKLKVGKTKLAKPKLLFKCKSGRKDCGKQDLMDVLKKNCRTQPTLFFKESSEDILKGEVYKCLGFRFKLKDDIKDIFFKTYILHTFTNSFYMDPEKYLTDITYLKIVYPDYSIERYNPFSNRERYMR
ncbi:hypothetical protein HHI36_001201 [Cryptolaemus montrouzieri]|uniref:Fanconi-associated nuclease n=1 Tax=Cryptolaemus montrouzieri TaxID=559131 RepID=A0ABD2P7Q2_9CUCU